MAIKDSQLINKKHVFYDPSHGLIFSVRMQIHSVKLNSGRRMPIIGLGTYLVEDKIGIFKMVETALETGYRAFDTAEMYNNEKLLGQAFKKYLPKFQLSRDDIFVTTKLLPSKHGPEATRAIINSLKNLDMTYVDLFLIHYPGVSGLNPSDPKNRELRTESWKCLEDAFKTGICKSIGVSNYCEHHLEHLLSICEVKPAINQVEFNPYCFQNDLLKYCESKGIAFEAYSSLGSQYSGASLLQDSVVRDIAKKHSKDVGQVLLKWAVQHGVIVIPKSKVPERIKSNLRIFDFELDSDEMAQLDALNKNMRLDWDSTDIV